MTKEEIELRARLSLLACRRAVRPSLEDATEMAEIFEELYKLAGDKEYKLFPENHEKRER